MKLTSGLKHAHLEVGMHYDKDSGLTLWKYDTRLTWIILDNLAMLIEYVYPDDRLIEIRIRALGNIVVQMSLVS